MTRIGIISDTHGVFDDTLREFLAPVDQIWHAGDIGGIEIADRIAAFRPLKAVYGNIDGAQVRSAWPRWQSFECEGTGVLATHIGGYPGRYGEGVAEMIARHRPKILVVGHSHILRVGYDKKNGLLHINPGAAGVSGFHKVRTAVRLVVDGGNIREMEVGEWPRG